LGLKHELKAFELIGEF